MRDGHVHTALFKMDNQQGPTIYHRELCLMLWGSLDGRVFEGEMGTGVCMVESLSHLCTWNYHIVNRLKGNAKECSNYRTVALISHASKVMLKILQDRLQQYMNCELPDVQAGFRKGRGTEIKLPTFTGSSKSKRVPEKHLFLLYWLCQSLWLCGSQ